MAKSSRALAVHKYKTTCIWSKKTAAVHKSFSGNVTLAMFLSSHGDGFGADYQVPLVHGFFSTRQVLAQTIKYHFPKDSGQVLAKKANPTLFMNCSWTAHALFIIQQRRGLADRRGKQRNDEWEENSLRQRKKTEISESRRTERFGRQSQIEIEGAIQEALVHNLFINCS